MGKHRKGTAVANMQIARSRAKRLGHELGNFRWVRGINHAYEAHCKLCHAYVFVKKGDVDTWMESRCAIRGTAVDTRPVRDISAPGGIKNVRDRCPGVKWRAKARKQWRARVGTLRRIFARKGIEGVITHVEGAYPQT